MLCQDGQLRNKIGPTRRTRISSLMSFRGGGGGATLERVAVVSLKLRLEPQ